DDRCLSAAVTLRRRRVADTPHGRCPRTRDNTDDQALHLKWGSAPNPGSVARGDPSPRAAPSQARCARLGSNGAPPQTTARSLAGTPRPAPLPRAPRAAAARGTRLAGALCAPWRQAQLGTFLVRELRGFVARMVT